MESFPSTLSNPVDRINYKLKFAPVVVALMILSLFAQAMAQDNADRTSFRRLPDLPQASGGQMAGVSNDTLLVIGGSYFKVPIWDAVGTASLMATYPIQSQWDLFLQILGLLGGGLAGVFMLGIFTRRAHGKGALVGVVASAIVLWLIQRYTRVHFFLYAAAGVSTCLAVGYLASVLIPSARQPLKGLTIHTAGGGTDRRRLTGVAHG